MTGTTNNKIKVAGYAQKVSYTDGIEYRNFSPDLVGVQLASDGGTPLFTMGNFSITTNLDPKSDKTFITNKFSNFVTLFDLNLNVEETQILLTDNATALLNLDKTNLGYYALFGSLTEFVRVSLEEIITNWPASLFINPVGQTPTGQVLNGYTFENYSYDSLTEVATFKINTTFIVNKFQLNYLTNGTIINTFNATNDLRNVTVNYGAYAVLFNNNEYPVLGFTGSTYTTNDYIYLSIKGDPFSGYGSFSKITYHIKPNKLKEEQFFNTLPDFEAYLLNRNVTPKYTASFRFPTKSEDGVILYVTDSVTWPTTDGYNIDFDTTEYVGYASKLLNISDNNDLYQSNLMNRFLVSESITSFDTTPVYLSDLDKDTSGQKVNKTLQIYGREYDEINKFITGINFANTVTYDKQDNTPDIYLKNLARVLGWNLISSVVENDLLTNYVTTGPSTYSGMSVGYTAAEADIELWRRLILNTPWVWKSKGARKAIEFLLKFIGAPQGLIEFNEYIYKANAPIDVDLFIQALELNGLDTDLSIYPIDSNGYPRPLPDTADMYFQNDGLWYRETGGSGSTIDILTGNNPHVGPYDGGYKYINQFRNLIPNFSAITISSQTITSGTTNLFTNYNLGVISNYTGATYVDVTAEDGSDLNGCVVVTTSIIPDPIPRQFINDCGCESPSDDDSLMICVSANTTIGGSQGNTCDGLVNVIDNIDLGVYVFQYNQYLPDGSIYLDSNSNPVLNTSAYASQECCKANNGTPFIYNQMSNPTDNNDSVVINTGYICCDSTGKCGCSISCKWTANQSPILLPPITPSYIGPQDPYLTFTSEDGSTTIVTPDGCNCVSQYTIAVPNVTDPNTGIVGYGCQLTSQGVADLALGTNSHIYQFYQSKADGRTNCYTNTIN